MGLSAAEWVKKEALDGKIICLEKDKPFYLAASHRQIKNKLSASFASLR